MQLDLKWIPKIGRYTVKRIEDARLLQRLNVFAPNDERYKLEHRNMYITDSRLEELQEFYPSINFVFDKY